MFHKHQVSIGGWLMFHILSIIPFVNIIMWLILLFDGTTNKTLKNYILSYIVMFILAVAFVIMFGAALFSQFDFPMYT